MKSLVTKLYLFSFFDDFVLIYPLYAVLFAESGLSVGQISILFIVWSVSGLLFEVPTGVLADKFSRKKILIIGQIIRAVGYVLWILEPTFWGFLSGFVLWGVSGAFISGTFEAFVYDELQAIGRAKEYVKVQGRAHSLSLIAVVCASVGAAAAISLGYTFVLALSVVAVLLAGFFIATLPESPRVKQIGQNYLGVLKEGVALAFKNPHILRIILFGSFIGTVFGSLDEYWSLYLYELDFGRVEISLGIALFYVAGAAGTFSAYKFEQLSNRVFVYLMAACGAFLLAGVLLQNLLSVLLIAAFLFGFALIDLVFGGRLQHAIAANTRATVTSVGGFVTEIMGLGVFALFGILAESYGVRGGLIVMAVTVLVVACGYRCSAPRRGLKAGA